MIWIKSCCLLLTIQVSEDHFPKRGEQQLRPALQTLVHTAANGSSPPLVPNAALLIEVGSGLKAVIRCGCTKKQAFNDRYAGQSRLMHLQHNSPDPPDQERDNFAALRQDFPEAAVRNGLKGSNPNRPFAAGVFDVSVAGRSGHSLRAHQ